MIETDDGSKFVSKFFGDFMSKKNIKRFSRCTSLGAVFGERFNRTIRALLKRPVFGRNDANWIDILPTITKQNDNRIHLSTKLTAIEASLKKNKGYVYQNLLDKRKKLKPKLQVNELV